MKTALMVTVPERQTVRNAPRPAEDSDALRRRVGRGPDEFTSAGRGGACRPYKTRLERRAVQLIGVLGALGACSSAPPPAAKAAPQRCPAVDPKVSLAATKRVNPSVDGEGRPVQVRVYQLVSDAKLRNATFEEIWQKDQETLATDLKTVAEHTLFPGETKLVPLKRNPDANYLALVALFREPQGKDWFVSYELDQASIAPPCPKAPSVPVFLDRMQIQDGEGRAEEPADFATPPTSEPPSATDGQGGT
jgi:type VI secretion system VasD/TssJ family lipoprotein